MRATRPSQGQLLRELRITFSRDDWAFDARWRNITIGRARCVQDGNTLLIGDLLVAAACPIPWPFANNLLVAIGLPCRRRNFRGLGVGTALLKRIIAEATKAGITHLRGNVTEGDIKATPHLLDWYCRENFTVEAENTGQTINAAVAVRISMNIA